MACSRATHGHRVRVGHGRISVSCPIRVYVYARIVGACAACGRKVLPSHYFLATALLLASISLEASALQTNANVTALSTAIARPSYRSAHFFDLGANNGNSVLEFLGLLESRSGLRIEASADRTPSRSRSHMIDIDAGPSWHVHAVEANPRFEGELQLVAMFAKRALGQEISSISLHVPAAVTGYDGTAELYLDNVNEHRSFWGSSLLSSHPDAQPSSSNGDHVKVNVTALDFSRVLRETVTQEDVVYVKMDIEGSEYDVLGRMIADGTISLVDRLWVEFHYWESEHISLAHSLRSSLSSILLEWS